MDDVIIREGGALGKRKKKKKEVVGEEHGQSVISEGDANRKKKENKKKKIKDRSNAITVSDVDHTEAKGNKDVMMEIINILDTDEEENAGPTVKKRKKKKPLKEGAHFEEDGHTDHASGKKKKTRKSLTTVNGDEISKEEFEEVHLVETPGDVKKKKKKRKADENGVEFTNEGKADIKKDITVLKAKKRKRKQGADSEEACMKLEDSSQEMNVKKKKKKKKKQLMEEDSLKKNKFTTANKHTKLKKEKKIRKDCNHGMENAATQTYAEMVDEKPRDIKKKKAKKKKDTALNNEKHGLGNSEEKKQKKKKSKGEDEKEPARQIKEEDEEQTTDTVAVNGKKRKKNKKDLNETSTEVETPTPKKKKKQSKESKPAKAIKKEITSTESATENQGVTDVVFLSEKPGNQDEMLIDQNRRLALQEDIDKESQPKPTFGQWGTAHFNNTDQQQKFLRLMGGFKKGNQPVTAGVLRPNMALGRDEQQNLQQKLLGQFEQAQNRRMDFTNRGAGLGFAAPSNKKFAIDVNASRSIKFDD